jgi:uncharacterized membrane protein HdeD (DUF308 family)
MMVFIPDWRAIALRSAAAILFGVAALVWPGITLTALVLLFGAFVLIDGIMNVYGAIRHDPADKRRRWLVALEGVAGIAVGVLTWVWPGITALALLWVIAAWAFVTGILEVAAAVKLRHEIRHEWLLGVLGLLSIAFAVALVVAPVAGALAITWLIGWYAIFSGVILGNLAWQARKLTAHAGGRGAATVRPAASGAGT